MADLRRSIRPTWWQRLLSYFTEVHLESVSSDLHPELHVSLQQGRLQLSTAKAIYSFSDLYTNFDQAFRQIRLKELPIQDVLLLGLGLGSIPYILEKKLDRRYHYTAVEVDEAIIELAWDYTLEQLDAPFHIINADALAFVYTTAETYDFICMDVFEEDVIPEEFYELEFMEALRGLLRPGGILLYNCLALTDADQRQAQFVFEERFRPVFPEGTFLDVGTNWILLNRKDILL